MRQDKGKSSGLVGKLVGAAAGAVIGLTSLLMPSRADAAPINVDSSMNVATINSTIAGSEKGDIINFTKGTYSQSFPEDAYNLKPNLNYTFSNVTINGHSSTEDPRIFRIADGGDMTLSGDLTLQNVMDGFYIGTTIYDNINISGVTFKVNRYGIWYDNLPHASPLTTAAIDVNNNVAEGGSKLIKYDDLAGTTANSPYASASKNTVRSLSSFMMDVPVANIPEGSLHNLGEDEIENNVLENCLALSDSDNYQYYHSPTNIAQKDVNSPYINESTNAFTTSNLVFIPGTLIPNRLTSPLVIRNEQGQMTDWIGAYKPMIPGDVNDDGFVSGADLNTIITNWGQSGMDWEDGDLTGDGLVGGADYNNVLSNWGSPGEPENIPEPTTLGLIATGIVGAAAWNAGRKRKSLADRLER